jgi:uncharacterized protein (TIGR01244 family)
MEHNLEWFGKYIWGEAPPAPAKPPAKAEPFSGIVNYAPIDDMFACAGNVKPEAAAEIKRRGYVAVVSLRSADEPGATVEATGEAVRAAGMKYIHIPTSQTNTITQATVEAFLAAVGDPANRPMVFHCGSGPRASAFWLIKRVRVDGWPVDRAVKEAEDLGLTAARKEAALRFLQGAAR